MLVIAFCSALLAGVSYGVWYGLDRALGRSLPAQLVSLLLGLAAGGLVYLRTTRRLGLDELERAAAAAPRAGLTRALRRPARPGSARPTGLGDRAEREAAGDLVEHDAARPAPSTSHAMPAPAAASRVTPRPCGVIPAAPERAQAVRRARARQPRRARVT